VAPAEAPPGGDGGAGAAAARGKKKAKGTTFSLSGAQRRY
jgi:hypothetical protein